MRHQVRVIPTDRPLVIYSGFLACPLVSDDTQEVVNLPANYALRKPHVFDELLAQADLVLTSDQHDAVFSEHQVEALIGFVEKGGSLVLFCGWSAPWGRGFFDTFGNVAGSRLPDILPLRMRKGITHARTVRLPGDGARTFASIPWDTIPAYDHNAAELRPGARSWRSLRQARRSSRRDATGRGRSARSPSTASVTSPTWRASASTSGRGSAR